MQECRDALVDEGWWQLYLRQRDLFYVHLLFETILYSLAWFILFPFSPLSSNQTNKPELT
jgi:hypothetical protein